MIATATDPGLVTRIDNGWMYVKVPVGSGCGACANKAQCTFSGPERAYRTIRIRQAPDCRVGDRILVDVPSSAFVVAGIVLVGIPVLMILAGYWLLDRWIRFPHAAPLLWFAGVAIWFALILAVNRWMERSTRFNERVSPFRGGPG